MSVEADHERIEGASNVRTLAPGRRFKPYDVANPGNVFEEYITLEIVHSARDRSYETNGGEPQYSNSIIAIPSRVPATPHPTTPRPKIDGQQIAIVAGPEGEEIHPDEYGRIKVWFPWDRRAKKDGSDTCWMRVSQNWAGAGWGGQVIPRIQMEVMVSYLDGDPDRPVVTGVVPNPRQKVPYSLPEHKTRSVFKTNTHKGRGFNELRFEDKTNEEEVRIIAQKDMNTMIRNNESKIVMKNSSIAVMDNKLSEVLGDSITSITGTFTLYTGPSGITALAGKGIGATANLLSQSANSLDRPMFANDAAPGDLTIISDGSHNVTVRESAQYHIGENYDLSVLNNHATRIEKNQSNSVGKSQNSYVGEFRTEQVGEKYIVFCGQSRIEIDKDGNIKLKGKNIDIEASDHISLRAKRIDIN